MAAVAGGACGSSATMLEQSLDRASSYFPKDEAEDSAEALPGARHLRGGASADVSNVLKFWLQWLAKVLTK